MSRRASAGGGTPSGPMAQPLAPSIGDLDDDDDDDEDDVEDDDEDVKNIGLRRIRFPKDRKKLAQHFSGADLSVLAENRRNVWYQYEELKHIKRKALSSSKEAQKRGLGVMLTNTYGKSGCSETQDALNTWSKNGNSRRGLERWINDEYAAKRCDIRKRTIQSVIRAQAKMKDSDLQDPEYSAKVLSRLSEAFSVDSKNFARGMGVADALAAQCAWENNNDDEQDDFDVSSSHTGTTSTGGKGTSSAPPIPASRKTSPLSVMSPITTAAAGATGTTTAKGKSVTGTSKRNLGLTAPTVSPDFRHYF